MYELKIKLKNKTMEKIDYLTLSKRVGDMLLCNQVTNVDEDLYDNLENGDLHYCFKHETKKECEVNDGNDCEFEGKEIYQTYLIDKDGADYLKAHTDELVFYSEKLDLYVWGITHFGTSWNCVYTTIK